MTGRPGQLVAAAVGGFVVTVAGTLLALGTGSAWPMWSPVLVFAVALGFFFQDPESSWGRGLLAGLGLGLLLGAGVCTAVFSY